MVAAVEDLSISGTAVTCADTIAGILRSKPDLLIVDVRLPDGTGFEVLQALDEPTDLQAIFLTAYEQYAVQAFDVAALDYLLKPVAQDRFLEAIQRVRDRLAQPLPPSTKRYARRFLVAWLKAAYLLPVESIYWIAADRNYALLYTAMGGSPCARPWTLLSSGWIPPNSGRVSRSAIVRVGAVREVRRREDLNHIVVLTSGAEVVCSKRYGRRRPIICSNLLIP